MSSAIVIALIIVLLVVFFRKMTSNSSSKGSQNYQTIDDQYNEKKAQEQKELDHLLDRINQKGIDHLSTREKKRLEELSRHH